MDEYEEGDLSDVLDLRGRRQLRVASHCSLCSHWSSMSVERDRRTWRFGNREAISVAIKTRLAPGWLMEDRCLHA